MALCWRDMEHSVVTLQRSLNALPKSLGQQARQINIFYRGISAGTKSTELLRVWWREGFSCHLSGPTDSFPDNSAYWPSLQTVATNQHGSVTFLRTLIWSCSTPIPDFSGSGAMYWEQNCRHIMWRCQTCQDSPQQVRLQSAGRFVTECFVPGRETRSVHNRSTVAERLMCCRGDKSQAEEANRVHFWISNIISGDGRALLLADFVNFLTNDPQPFSSQPIIWHVPGWKSGHYEKCNWIDPRPDTTWTEMGVSSCQLDLLGHYFPGRHSTILSAGDARSSGSQLCMLMGSYSREGMDGRVIKMPFALKLRLSYR